MRREVVATLYREGRKGLTQNASIGQRLEKIVELGMQVFRDDYCKYMEHLVLHSPLATSGYIKSIQLN